MFNVNALEELTIKLGEVLLCHLAVCLLVLLQESSALLGGHEISNPVIHPDILTREMSQKASREL